MRSNFRKIVFRIALWFGVIAVVFGGVRHEGRTNAEITVKGACCSLRHDRPFGSRAVHFRMASGIQAGDRNHRDHGDVARKGRGICGRRAVRGGLEFLFRTGTVDSVSDACVGAYRLLCGSFFKGAYKKQAFPVFLRCIVGRCVFAVYGHLDGNLR